MTFARQHAWQEDSSPASHAKKAGQGTPRILKVLLANALLFFLRFWIAVLARAVEEGIPLLASTVSEIMPVEGFTAFAAEQQSEKIQLRMLDTAHK